MDGRGRGRLSAVMLAVVWACITIALSYLTLDDGTDTIYIAVMGLVSFIFMLMGLLMFMSSFQNINAAMVREFLEVEIPSLARHMGLILWFSSVLFYAVFAVSSICSSALIGVAVAFVVFVAIVLSATVYLSRCGKYEKS